MAYGSFYDRGKTNEDICPFECVTQTTIFAVQ